MKTTPNSLMLLSLLALSVFLKIQGALAAVQMVEAFPELGFERPVFLTHAGDQTNRVFVVEQGGKIHVFPNDKITQETKVFLDIKSKLSATSGEQGLLGLAFDPAFKTNRKFYVNFTAPNPLRTVIAGFKAKESNPNEADPLSMEVLLEINQPYSNHNGGMIAFGKDGFLYIGMGDGGSGGDPQNNAQNLNALLGKILRIDPSSPDVVGGKPYSIPAANPYFGLSTGARPEIFAYGVRNPWRFSFDRLTGELWIADVGQNQYEEVNRGVVAGQNLGWRTCEGFHSYESSNSSVNCANPSSSYKAPIFEYTHALGQSITGGYVYRGLAAPSLQGKYLFGDYVKAKVWALSQTGDQVQTELVGTLPQNLSSFGEDEAGEVYLIGYSGAIYKFQ